MKCGREVTAMMTLVTQYTKKCSRKFIAMMTLTAQFMDVLSEPMDVV